MGVLEELADKYGGLISDLRFDYKRREAAMMDLLAMQLQKIPQWIGNSGRQCCICLDSRGERRETVSE